MRFSFRPLSRQLFITKKGIFLYSVILGAMAVLGLAPIYFMPASFISFGLFVCILDRIFAAPTLSKNDRLKLFIFASWAFGIGYFLAGFFWLGNALATMDNLHFIFIPFLILLFAAGLAFFWGFAGGLSFFLWQNNFSRFFAFTISFGLAEWLRGHLFTGLPWNGIGYALMPSPLFMQSSALIGLYGVNLFACLLFSLSAAFFQGKDQKLALLLMLGIFTAHIAIGVYFLNEAGNLGDNPHLKKDGTPFTVRLLQPNVPPSEKFDPKKIQQNFTNQLALAKAPPSVASTPPDLIIWPETAIPVILSHYPSFISQLGDALLPKQLALLGTVRMEGRPPNGKFFNSIETFDKYGNRIATSDKLHLVPFGEYLPLIGLLKSLGLSTIINHTEAYSSALKRRTVYLPNGLTYLPLICYEIIFPTEMQYEGPKPHFIVNVTNDMWYGRTAGPYQHLQQARLRAVEQRLPVLRAANNGISAVIDPYGRVISSLALNELGIVDAILPSENINTARFCPGNLIFFGIFITFILCHFMTRKVRNRS